ncbi:MAG: hypothetical protein KF838_08055 [Phycisphaeraceae bacterium]|nr:MAG: hypothetical protein KF838_08055 [Phycisphaeraceae bacterium]
MRVAFHYDEDVLGNADKATEHLLKLARRMNLPIRSRLYVGSLLIRTGAQEQSKKGSTCTRTTQPETLRSLVREWLTPQPFNWYALTSRAVEVVITGTVHCNLYDTIEPRHALALHNAALEAMPEVYVGALQVDERVPSHLAGYQLVPWLRIDEAAGYVNWDGINQDSKRPWVVEMLERVGYDPVEHEDVSARFTIFDRQGGAEGRHRSAQCRGAMVELFDGVIDAAIVRVRDAMPEVHERLWAVLRAFESAEIDEQLAQVAVSCRRLVEYAAECLYPPRPTAQGERKLDQAAWKNRLLAYFEDHQVADADKGMIVANIDHTAACVDRLLEVINRGVHASTTREQTRRCILGTVLLLDDLCSVTRGGFSMRVALDKELLHRIAGRGPKKPHTDGGS